MTERDAFVAAIIDDPAADSRREIFADWLEENGEGEYAEFIRVQLELSRSFPSGTPILMGYEEIYERWRKLWTRQRELLSIDGPPIWGTHTRVRNFVKETQAYRWMGPCVAAKCCVFVRGFVESVEIRFADWVKFAASILAAHPVNEVTLLTFPEREEMLQLLRSRGYSDERVRSWDRSHGNDFFWDNTVAWESLKPLWPRIERWNRAF